MNGPVQEIRKRKENKLELIETSETSKKRPAARRLAATFASVRRLFVFVFTTLFCRPHEMFWCYPPRRSCGGRVVSGRTA